MYMIQNCIRVGVRSERRQVNPVGINLRGISLPIIAHTEKNEDCNKTEWPVEK